MALSPFREKAIEAVKLANQFVQTEFQVNQPWTGGNVKVGGREAVVLFSALDDDPDFSLPSSNRAIQRPALRILGSLMVIEGHQGYESAQAAAIGLMFDIKHTIPLLKAYNQLQNIGEFFDARATLPIDVTYSSPRPESAVKDYAPKDIWVVRVSCDVELKFILGREKTGAHAPQWANIQDMQGS